MRKILKASALLAAVTLVAVTGAGAAVSPSYQVTGAGTGGPQSNGSQFNGSGVGAAGDAAHWQASVVYQMANCPTVGTPCGIAGGTFTLKSHGSQLNDSFSDGTLELLSADSGCGAQRFTVTGNLTGDSPLVLAGTLTTDRSMFKGQCVVRAATLDGSLAPPESGPIL